MNNAELYQPRTGTTMLNFGTKQPRKQIVVGNRVPSDRFGHAPPMQKTPYCTRPLISRFSLRPFGVFANAFKRQLVVRSDWARNKALLINVSHFCQLFRCPSRSIRISPNCETLLKRSSQTCTFCGHLYSPRKSCREILAIPSEHRARCR